MKTMVKMMNNCYSIWWKMINLVKIHHFRKVYFFLTRYGCPVQYSDCRRRTIVNKGVHNKSQIGQRYDMNWYDKWYTVYLSHLFGGLFGPRMIRNPCSVAPAAVEEPLEHTPAAQRPEGEPKIDDRGIYRCFFSHPRKKKAKTKKKQNVSICFIDCNSNGLCFWWKNVNLLNKKIALRLGTCHGQRGKGMPGEQLAGHRCKKKELDLPLRSLSK